MKGSKLILFIVSDATGKTAESMLRSALAQFKGAPWELVRRGEINTQQQVHAVVREAAEVGAGLIIHTLVRNNLRGLLLAEARAHGLDSMDLMGPLLDRLTTHLRLMPREKPGLFKQLAEAKSREIEAVEFAFRHDDGQHPEGLKQAELVLTGVSRTMKTPITLYLAYRGWFAANVPLIPKVAPPPELLALPPERVFCLVTSPERLLELRRVRAGQLGTPIEGYASLAHLRQELLYARRLGRDHGWQEIDVTGKSVEEVAGEILALLPKRAG
ncbi:MAG: kinase/pyrophosphorylase [Thermoflexales bacterium]|nr:kinase/pyrophosphorylase [Thermoflexales bacterium]